MLVWHICTDPLQSNSVLLGPSHDWHLVTSESGVWTHSLMLSVGSCRKAGTLCRVKLGAIQCIDIKVLFTHIGKAHGQSSQVRSSKKVSLLVREVLLGDFCILSLLIIGLQHIDHCPGPNGCQKQASLDDWMPSAS